MREGIVEFRRIRPSIVERDGSKCVKCGWGECLEVHHRDQNRANNDPANLVTLCVLCHNHFHLSGASTEEWLATGLSGPECICEALQEQGIVLGEPLFTEALRSYALYGWTLEKRRARVRNIRPGAKPYGYYPGEDEMVVRIRQMRATGMPYLHIARQLNAEGVRSRRGQWWPYGVSKVCAGGAA